MNTATILTLFWISNSVTMTSQEYLTADACNAAGITLSAVAMQIHNVGKLRYECISKETGAIRTARPK